MKNNDLKKLNLDMEKKQKVSAGTVICFRHRYKDEDGDNFEYIYEVSVPKGNSKNNNTWERYSSLEEAIERDRFLNKNMKKVHVIRTWLPEGQRDEFI